MHEDDDTGAAPAPLLGRRRTPWLIGLLAGVSALAALVLFITHAGDITTFARQAANAKAGPLFAALGAQAAPYLIASYVWFHFLRRIDAPLPFASLVPLSFAKLFADQAIPSGGLSGAAFFLFALTRRGVPDKAAFRKALASAPFTSVRGDFSFNTNGFPIQDFYVVKAVKRPDGRFATQIQSKVFDNAADAYVAECPLK